MHQIRIVFLGTSAGTPSRERNLAAVAVVMDGRTLLFDCGEGTQQQIMRSSVRMGAIESVFLSHLHGDHLYGLPGLLATMSLHGRTAPLALHGPVGVRRYLEGVFAASHAGSSFDISVNEVSGESTFAFDGFDVHAMPLDHTAPCFGYAIVEHDLPGTFNVEKARALGVPPGPDYRRLQHGVAVGSVRPEEVLGPPRKGRRIVYCTDTRPCPNAIALARDADVLIHESTYANDMAADATPRGHSTAAEAASIAREAHARRLLLTHISPRYTDPSPLLAEARAIFPETDLAADFAEVEVPLAARPPAR